MLKTSLIALMLCCGALPAFASKNTKLAAIFTPRPIVQNNHIIFVDHTCDHSQISCPIKHTDGTTDNFCCDAATEVCGANVCSRK